MTRFAKGIPYRLLSVGFVVWLGPLALEGPVTGDGHGVIIQAAKGIKEDAEAVVERRQDIGSEDRRTLGWGSWH